MTEGCICIITTNCKKLLYFHPHILNVDHKPYIATRVAKLNICELLFSGSR